MDKPPQSCFRLLDHVHELYNRSAFEEMRALGGEALARRYPAGDWSSYCQTLRRDAGRLRKVNWIGHNMSPLSLLSITVDFFVTADFDNGPRQEHIRIYTGLLQKPELLDFRITDPQRG